MNSQYFVLYLIPIPKNTAYFILVKHNQTVRGAHPTKYFAYKLVLHLLAKCCKHFQTVKLN